MTAQVKLIQKQDMAVDRVVAPLDPTLNLLPYIAHTGWTPAAYQADKSMLDETFTLTEDTLSGDALADLIQSIDAMLRKIELQGHPERNFVWLRAQLAGETNARQAAVLSVARGKTLTNSDVLYDALQPALVKHQILLTRMSPWEKTTSTTEAFSACSINGGTIDLSISGDMPARIARLKIVPNTQHYTDEFWFGLKSDRYGCDPTNFIPVWPLHKAAGFGADTENDAVSHVVYGSGIADADCIDGYRVQCSFATAYTSMTKRIFMRLSDVTATHQLDQVGTYQVLLRARCYGSLTALVRVGSDFIVGPDGGANDGTGLTSYQSPQLIGYGAAYKYYPLGVVTLPISYLPTDVVSKVGLVIDAEYISGTGSLYFDSIILVPDEYRVHVNEAYAFQYSPTPPYNYFEIYTRPDGRVIGKSYLYESDLAGSSPYGNVMADDSEWSLPVGNSRLVVAGQYTGGSLLSTTVTPYITYYNRWANLRGSG
jgi:hypothetical protein